MIILLGHERMVWKPSTHPLGMMRKFVMISEVPKHSCEALMHEATYKTIKVMSS
jgi:hypothetical protein